VFQFYNRLFFRFFGVAEDETQRDPVLQRYASVGTWALTSATGVWPLVVWGFLGTWPPGSVARTLLLASPLIGVAVMLGAGLLLRLQTDARVEARRHLEAERLTVYIDSSRTLDALKEQREKQERDLFKSNLEHLFVLQHLELHDIHFFEDASWRFAPRVNVLLGRNGYGKTLLFRALAAIIQNDIENSRQLVRGTDGDAYLRLTVTKNGESADIVRKAAGFSAALGKIPLLAIPDSRFVNRAETVIELPSSSVESDAETAAWHFLQQQPFGNRVDRLLYQLALDHQDPRFMSLGRRGFAQPLFRLLEETVRKLTDDERFRFRDIVRAGPTGFQILVSTSGNEDEPLPIQYASQGTLSILAVFGLVYNFLAALEPKTSTEIPLRSGLVLIDEIDAHLHPAWQQKVMGMLTTTFPNVQFIVSAHSPLIVAGCDFGEVSVLRPKKGTDRFAFETLTQDFLGATVAELYDVAFNIEDADRLYLQYSTEATRRAGQVDPRRVSLEERASSGKLSSRDAAELDKLRREDGLVKRAEAARDRRFDQIDLEAKISQLEMEVHELRAAERTRLAQQQRPPQT